MPTPLDHGRTIAAQLLAKLPEHLRPVVEQALGAPEAVEALNVLGTEKSSVEALAAQLATRQAELDAAIAQTNAEYQANVKWLAENEPRLADYNRIKPEYDALKAAPPKPPTPNPAPGSLTEDQLNTILRERDQQYGAVLAYTTTLAAQHLQRFGEVLDVTAIIRHANEKHVDLPTAYQTVHAETIAAKNKADEDARINGLVEARMAELRKSDPQPFMTRGDQGTSPLDLIDPAKTEEQRKAEFSVDRAAAHYEELVASSYAAGRPH